MWSSYQLLVADDPNREGEGRQCFRRIAAITSKKERSITTVDKDTDRLPSFTWKCGEASRSRLGGLAGGEVTWKRIGRRGEN